jgi:hypothetical protein
VHNKANHNRLMRKSALGLRRMKLIRKVLNGVIFLAAAAGVLLGVAAFRLARLPYNSEGRYFDGVVVTHESAPVACDFLCAGAFFIAGIAFLFRRYLMRKTSIGHVA